MSADLTPQEPSRAPMGAGMQSLQKVGVLAAKAALSAIPWAALVFDVGQTAVDYGNARLTDRLLGDLGERIDRMEAGARERLKADEIYQLSAQAAIRRMLTETNSRMADALARAVAKLGASSLPAPERMELARALDILTEPSLHLLQMNFRFDQGALTREELDQAGSTSKRSLIFSRILLSSMSLVSWIKPERDLEIAGLIETILGGGEVGLPPEEEVIVEPRRILPLGKRVLALCFDDPGSGTFGRFAG